MLHGHAPLRQRIISSSNSNSGYQPTNINPRIRPGTYRLWKAENLENAIKAVERGESIRKSAEIHGVPKSTLSDYVSGKNRTLEGRSGAPYLTMAEEEELVSFLIKSASIGYPRTRKDIICIVQQIMDSKGRVISVSSGWLERFKERHPQLTIKSAVPLSQARAMSSNTTVLTNYYNILQASLEDNGILDEPRAIYNCDETGLPLCPPNGKVIDVKGSKHPTYITSGNKAQFTVLACTSATGSTLPPYIVLDRKTLNHTFTEGEVPGTLYGLSHNGWMNRELFHQWFLNHFLQYAPPTRPLMLIMDGHSSHYCPDTIKLAAENQIILFALPPNSTHITQPLDRACFSPLKSAWREVCHDFCIQNPGKVVSRHDFSKLFSKAWFKAMTISNVIAGFRVTGICPFDRSATMKTGSESTQVFDPSSLVKRTGLAYIPFYSPLRPPKSNPDGNKYNTSSQLSNSISSFSSPDHLCEISDLETSFMSPQPRCNAQVSYRHSTSVSRFLKLPPGPSTYNATKEVSGKSGIVMTSRESLKKLEEKQRRQEEKENEKKVKQKAREEKEKLKKTNKITSTTASRSGKPKLRNEKLALKNDMEVDLNKGTEPSSPITILDTAPVGKSHWWIKPLNLFEEDKLCLIDGQDLTDKVINAAQKLAKQQFPEFSGFQDTILGIKLLFKAVGGDRPSVQILHTGHSHWLCTTCSSPDTGPVNILDSASHMEVTPDTILQIASIYKPLDNELVIQQLPVQQQKGGHDCGVFSIAYMVEICHGNNAEKITFNQPKMREHLKKCLESGKMTLFPRGPKTNTGSKLPKKIIVKEVLYCTCRMPDFYTERMISCDTCNEWYHCSCMKISNHRTRTRKQASCNWICPPCTSRQEAKYA